jgi:hypothetical protein
MGEAGSKDEGDRVYQDRMKIRCGPFHTGKSLPPFPTPRNPPRRPLRAPLSPAYNCPLIGLDKKYIYELLPPSKPPASIIRWVVPFLTGQKGDEKSRRAVRAAADVPAPRRGRESKLASLRHRFAKRPSAAQSRPRRRTAKGPEKDCTKEGGKCREAFTSVNSIL